LAEQAGDLTLDGMQRLLNFYRWDADAVRDDLHSYVLRALEDTGSGVVVADSWSVEETFQFAKSETSLDHYQVRKYDA
jgi:hypothetical protein